MGFAFWYLYMTPFILLLTLFLLLNILGRLGIPFSFGWWTALRISLAAMFLLTASAHWGRRRADLIRMIPPRFPRPDLLVSITGVLEILGAVGLLIPTIAPFAGLSLSLFLLAVFPANVHRRARAACDCWSTGDPACCSHCHAGHLRHGYNGCLHRWRAVNRISATSAEDRGEWSAGVDNLSA